MMWKVSLFSVDWILAVFINFSSAFYETTNKKINFQRKDCGNLVDSWLRKAFKGTVVNYFCRSKKGIPLNYIFSTLNKLYFRVDDCPLKAAVVTCLISKPMELAKYFSTGKLPFWRILDPFINTSAASLKIATMT